MCRWHALGYSHALGGVAVFLASEASRFINGHVLYVDVGVTSTL
jgi:gluconate 5-dehydrogenase